MLIDSGSRALQRCSIFRLIPGFALFRLIIPARVVRPGSDTKAPPHGGAGAGGGAVGGVVPDPQGREPPLGAHPRKISRGRGGCGAGGRAVT